MTINARKVHLIDPRRIKLVTEKDSPIYDERIEEPLKDGTLAKWRLGKAFVPPVVLVTPDTAAMLGYPIDSAEYDGLIFQGRQRVKYALASNTALIEAFFDETVESIEDYNLRGVEENTHRLEMSYDQQVAKARRFYAAGITDIARLAECFNTVESTVAVMLDIGAKADQIPALKAALDAGELNSGIGNQLKGEPAPVVEAVLAEMAKVQAAALNTAIDQGKTEGRVQTDIGNATIGKNEKGEPVVTVSQDTVQQIKGRVKGTGTPKSAQGKGSTAGSIDLALVRAKLGNVSIMRKLPNADDSYIAGFEAALKGLLGETVEAPEGASYIAMHRIIFPAKA